MTAVKYADLPPRKKINERQYKKQRKQEKKNQKTTRYSPRKLPKCSLPKIKITTRII